MPPLSASAEPFVPSESSLSVKYLFDQYFFLKSIEAKAMSNPALLSSIKSAIYRLIDQMKFLPNPGSIYSPDSNFNSTSLCPTLSPVSNIIYTGSNYSPVSVNSRSLQFSNDSIGSSNSPASSFTNSSPDLTTRNIKRKQRAQTWRANHAQHNSRSVRPTTNSIRPHFYKYLVDVDAGKIKVPKCTLPSHSSFEVFKARLPPSPKISYSSIISFPTIFLPPSKYPISSSPIKMRHIHRPPLSPTPTISFNNNSLVFPTIPIPTWPTNYSTIFNLFTTQSFTSDGYTFEERFSFTDTLNKVNTCDDSISISEFFHYSLILCSITFCKKYLQCCELCGLTSTECGNSPICWRYCSDCYSPHRFCSCPKFHLWLHDPDSSYRSAWIDLVRNHLITSYVPTFKTQKK